MKSTGFLINNPGWVLTEVIIYLIDISWPSVTAREIKFWAAFWQLTGMKKNNFKRIVVRPVADINRRWNKQHQRRYNWVN